MENLKDHRLGHSFVMQTSEFRWKASVRERNLHKGPSTCTDLPCFTDICGKVSPDFKTLGWRKLLLKKNQLRTTTFYSFLPPTPFFFFFKVVPDICLLQQVLCISTQNHPDVLILVPLTQSPPTDTVSIHWLIFYLQHHYAFFLLWRFCLLHCNVKSVFVGQQLNHGKYKFVYFQYVSSMHFTLMPWQRKCSVVKLYKCIFCVISF